MAPVRVGYTLIAVVGVAFALAFAGIVIPALVRDGGDVVGGLAAGFVNPYSSGYSLDVLCCWAVLALWVLVDRRELRVRHGWVCLVLGIVPGVATGFAAYLLLRHSASSARGRGDSALDASAA
ncbi:MAG: DUF2834 domain-containing protein [Aeromicrobium sp.]|uniref:DUF2834 domain-containing protein n=1 Tax=Aeromicrobium sp. TaxID=1871063 RepID=UPI00261B194F|nr:DUF2834 domain-containing protein [Aeromicrobium sp.]MDF1704101.1 DUF2834 domain-containing protein [Aeromicrobium sp.]